MAGCYSRQVEESGASVTQLPSIQTKEPRISPLETPRIDFSASQTAEPNASYKTYEVKLDLDPQNRLVSGVEKISFENQTGDLLDQLVVNVYANAFSKDYEIIPYFHSFKNKIFQYGMDYADFKVMNVACNLEEAHFELDGVVLNITPAEQIKLGEKVEITVQFEAYIPKISHRMGANDDAIWFGNFIPTLAVYENGSWRTNPYYPAGDPFYSETANYNVSVKTPSAYQVVGTGVETTSESGDEKTTTLTARLARDFAFVVGNHFTKETVVTNSGVEVNFYSYSESPYQKEFLDIADQSVEYYSKIVGSLLFTQLDIVECDLFLSGGMEYPEIIFMDSERLQQKEAVQTIAHEIGHQWFYNIIGNDQIQQAWIDEGVTMVIQQGIFYDGKDLKTKMNEEYELLKNQIKHIDNRVLSSDLSVYHNWSDYYNIQYTKGKLMVFSLMEKMGQEKFYEFLKTYYSENIFSIVNEQIFIETAERVLGEDLSDFFERWLRDSDLPPLY